MNVHSCLGAFSKVFILVLSTFEGDMLIYASLHIRWWCGEMCFPYAEWAVLTIGVCNIYPKTMSFLRNPSYYFLCPVIVCVPTILTILYAHGWSRVHGPLPSPPYGMAGYLPHPPNPPPSPPHHPPPTPHHIHRGEGIHRHVHRHVHIHTVYICTYTYYTRIHTHVYICTHIHYLHI